MRAVCGRRSPVRSVRRGIGASLAAGSQRGRVRIFCSGLKSGDTSSCRFGDATLRAVHAAESVTPCCLRISSRSPGYRSELTRQTCRRLSSDRSSLRNGKDGGCTWAAITTSVTDLSWVSNCCTPQCWVGMSSRYWRGLRRLFERPCARSTSAGTRRGSVSGSISSRTTSGSSCSRGCASLILHRRSWRPTCVV